MKQTICIFLVLSSILLTGSIPNEPSETPLQTLIEIAEENELPISHWEVLMKESLSLSDFQKIVNTSGNSHLVAGIEPGNSIKYDFVGPLETNDINLEQRVLFPENNPQQVELIAVLSGEGWDEEIELEFKQTKAMLESDFFLNNLRTFSCIEILKDDTIGDRVVINLFTDSLQLVHTKEQSDSVEMSKLKNVIYGYTTLWDEKFIIKGIPFNLQIAASQLETGNTAYMIGTPILMNEY